MPQVAWLTEITSNEASGGTTYRWWSRTGNLTFGGVEYQGAGGIISVEQSETTAGLPDGRASITFNASLSKTLRTSMLQDIGPAPVRLKWIADFGNGWEELDYEVVGTLSAPRVVSGLVTFEIETRRSFELKIPKMWSHSDQRRRDPTDDFFEYKEALASRRVEGTWPPRRG